MPEPLKPFAAQKNEKLEPINQPINQRTQSRVRLSLDVWAVGVAALLALLVRLGALKHVPW
jgi:hypothetical protein